ncbi:MAG: Tim44 domain-containing protein [Burkholderiaceae bacterium]|nr:Tim44 domain-containing protein [Burkholderiaceae bacterium]
MRNKNWLALVACVCLLSAPVIEAQAKRLGGGGNIGRVAPSPAAKPQAVPAKPATPQAAPQGQQAAKPAAATAAQTPKKNSWLGPIAGLAAGLGLAALASYLGFGEELMSLMLIVLAVVVLFGLFRWFAARKQAQSGSYGEPALARSGYGNADLGPEGRPSDSGWSMPASGGQSSLGASAHSAPAVDAAVSQQEVDQFLKVAREQFTKLQAIWDSGDIHSLAEFCTPEMNRELSHQIADRKGAVNVTQVVSLDTEWMGMVEGLDDFGKPVDEVRVRFKGLIREAANASAVDFDEVWTLQRVKGGDTGWLLAGIMQFGQ